MKSALKDLGVKLTPAVLQKFLIRTGRYFEWMRIDPAVREKMEKASRDPKPAFPSVEAALLTLRESGWQPQRCIDIGAYHGEWSKMFGALFPACSVLMIEAQDSKREHLAVTAAEMASAHFEMALLGAEDDVEVEFNEMETGSSVFEESSPFPRSKVTKKLSKLDTLLARHPEFIQAEMLKLDTQGYELEILKGAESVLKNIQAVLMETSLLPVNRQAPTFSSVIEFMHKRGFELFDFCSQIRRKDGVLWQTDLLFIRPAAFSIKAELTLQTWG